MTSRGRPPQRGNQNLECERSRFHGGNRRIKGKGHPGGIRTSESVSTRGLGLLDQRHLKRDSALEGKRYIWKKRDFEVKGAFE